MSTMNKFKLLEIIKTLYSAGTRVIKGERFSRDNHNAVQYHSGNEDYCPTDNTSSIVGAISNNLASSVVYLYKDQIARVAEKGEKRIYATDEAGAGVVGEIHFKNDGKIYIEATDNLDVVVGGNCNVTIQGTANINVTGNTTLTTPLFTINGSTLFNGNVSYGAVVGGGNPEIDGTATMKSTAVLNNQGTINNTGEISGAGQVKEGSIRLGTHRHSGVQSGNSNTGTPV